jgi:hypothetical protein
MIFQYGTHKGLLLPITIIIIIIIIIIMHQREYEIRRLT